MSSQPQPASPAEPVREGSRWRYHKPSSDEVAEWFRTVPLDDGMEHADYISGVVVIRASEKVRRAKADGRGTEEAFEDTYTPYVRVDTRIAYFRKLAAKDELIAVIEPVPVPRSEKPAFENLHMPEGFWWHIVGEGNGAKRFLCCTMRVALYDKAAWLSAEAQLPRALREGVATKQVTGMPDENGLAKAETGAVGRALGMAGILVVGTGVATAEDMAELREGGASVDTAALPPAGAAEESPEAVSERLLRLQADLRRHPVVWQEFCNWWQERANASGWATIDDATPEARRGVADKMEKMIEAIPEAPPTDSNLAEGAVGTPPGIEAV